MENGKWKMENLSCNCKLPANVLAQPQPQPQPNFSLFTMNFSLKKPVPQLRNSAVPHFCLLLHNKKPSRRI